MRKLRLLLFEECRKSCPGCCNHQWDLANLPIETDFSRYDEVLLTGGEPMLQPYMVMNAIFTIQDQSDAKIFLYTADVYRIGKVQMVMSELDGITVTLHDNGDANDFIGFYELVNQDPGSFRKKSLRLNVFEDVDISMLKNLQMWKVKENMKWIDNCPLPEGEVFKRYK